MFMLFLSDLCPNVLNFLFLRLNTAQHAELGLNEEDVSSEHVLPPHHIMKNKQVSEVQS